MALEACRWIVKLGIPGDIGSCTKYFCTKNIKNFKKGHREKVEGFDYLSFA